MADLLARAAVFAAPARYEPFGLGVLEAARSGCALVLADIATFRELWDGAAHFVAPDDAREWARALEELAQQPARRAALAAAARLRAEDYGLDRMVDNYCRVYAAARMMRPRQAKGAVA